MSQQLTPINGGVLPEVQTSVAQAGLNVLSPQYIEANKLQSRPTEWVPAGRPIYRRLPAVSETYQIDFFNVITESSALTSNIVVKEGIEEIGYAYVPYGESINGATSIEVVSSDNKKNLLVKGGIIIWKYGKTEVLPTIVNLEVLDTVSGKYDIAYQLLYDDAPQSHLYSVKDFSLCGLPLNISSSTDGVVGWRYPAVNAFLNSADKFWSNEDTFYPTYAQPTQAYLQWESELPQSYEKLVLRLPKGTAYTGTATLSYVANNVLSFVETVTASTDIDGQFFEFVPEATVLQNGWNVTFSDTKISVQSITVSGVLTLLTPQAVASPRATLVMYPSGTLPKTVINSQGEKVPATYCPLAEIDIDNKHTILDINDTRLIVHRDYVPVANWLTTPFDQDLISLYEQVLEYPTLWMAPPSCLKQEYANLSSDLITVEA